MASPNKAIVSSDGHSASLRPERSRLLPLAVFFGFFLLYFSISPLYFRPMGYMEEEFAAAKQVMAGVVRGFSSAPVIEWPRHGALPVLLHVPFVAAGRILFGPSLEGQDMAFAMEPIVFTAALLTLLFVWARGTGASVRLALIASTGAAFCTIYWPYAYFGMEPAQSLFLLLAGYLGMQHRRSGWPSVLALGIATGMAASLKSTGIFLIPALLFANWVFFMASETREARRTIPRVAAASAVAIGIILFSAYSRGLFWAPRGGTSPYLQLWLVRDPITYLLNVVAFLTSPNKGLFVFVPLALLAVVRIPGLISRGSRLAGFTALVVMAIAFSYPLFLVWSDETFGPRYFHCAIAPLVLCLVEAWRQRETRAMKRAGLLVAALLGFVIAGLGALFGYGHMQTVATQARQATLENFQGNTQWNHVRFNARLLRAWLVSDTVIWTPDQRWIGPPPEWGPPWQSVNLTEIRDVNLRKSAQPQAYVISTWGAPTGRLLRAACVAAFLAGFALLFLASRHRTEPATEVAAIP